MGLFSFFQRNKVEDQPQKKDLIGAELSVYRSPYYAKSQFNRYNPDDLVQKKGSVDIYRKMLTDDQVKAVCTLKNQIILGNGYTIESGDDETRGFIEQVLNDEIDGNFIKILKSILTALHFGFSVSEKIYKIIESGEFKGKIGLKTIKTRPPHSFEFETDDYGNLEEVLQAGQKGYISIKGEDLKKFIIYSFDADNAAFGNIYGNSDLRASYRSWFSRDIITRFLNIYLERFGMGILVAKYPRGLSSTEQTDIQDMINNIQAKTSFKLPQDVQVELLESSKAGQAGFIEALDYHSKSISRSILLPDLLGFSDNKSGSYNLGEHQFDMFYDYIRSIREEVQELLNEHLICDLIDKNFPNVTEYPKFKFNPFNQSDKKKMVELFITATEKGVIQATEEDEEYLRDIIEFPERTEESTLLPKKEPATNPNGFTPFMPNGSQPVASAEPIEKKPIEEEPIKEAGGYNCQCVKCGHTMVSDKHCMEIKCEKCGGDMRRQDRPASGRGVPTEEKFSKATKRIDFKKIERETNEMEMESAIDVGKIATKMKDSLIMDIIGDKIVENKDFKAVNNMQLKYVREMRILFKGMLRKSFKQGQKNVKDEFKGEKFANKSGSISKLPPKEALKYLESKAFEVTDKEKTRILGDAKQMLLDGMKTGATQDDIIYNLEEYFEQYDAGVWQRKANGELERVEDIGGRVQTIVRTNVFDAYNQGRMNEYNSDDLKDFIVAYEYNATMDDRTSALCHSLNGKIYKKDNPIIANITPPLHFNCRSMLVPITQVDGWDGKQDKVPSKDDLNRGFGK